MAKLYFRYGAMNCGKKARFNARYVDGKFTLDGEPILIDRSNKRV